MLKIKYVLLLSVLLTLCAVTAINGVNYESFTERDFKKMKIKELRTFLDDRGLKCVGCQEKTDFVRLAFSNKDKAPVASASKRAIPDGELWDVWREVARNVCNDTMKKKNMLSDDNSNENSVCSVLSQAVESFFMQHGKQTASKLKKSTHHMLKTSYKNVYYDAGHKLIEKLVQSCLSSQREQAKCQSLSHVMSKMEQNKHHNFKTWITNVGIENTNHMFDILDDGADLEGEELLEKIINEQNEYEK